MKANNYINHIALVLDASGSMQGRETQICKVADNLIQHLARRSQELDQETRVTIYSFADNTECLVYDKDVLRLPSIAKLYKTHGWTALIDATLKSLDDLSKTPELYGDHSFLVYVLTDGQENCSRMGGPAILKDRLAKLPDHWTVAVFVPDATCLHEAKQFGFPRENVQVWDVNAKQGLEGVGATILKTTDAYMEARTVGVRGSKNLFNLDVGKVNAKEIYKVLEKFKGKHSLLSVDTTSMISTFVERVTGKTYQIGKSYYELTKTEKVQAAKQIALIHKKTGDVFTGKYARQLLGLPDTEVKIAPADTADFSIFIQSTSVNRKLVPGTSVLVLH